MTPITGVPVEQRPASLAVTTQRHWHGVQQYVETAKAGSRPRERHWVDGGSFDQVREHRRARRRHDRIDCLPLKKMRTDCARHHSNRAIN